MVFPTLMSSVLLRRKMPKKALIPAAVTGLNSKALGEGVALGPSAVLGVALAVGAGEKRVGSPSWLSGNIGGGDGDCVST